MGPLIVGKERELGKAQGEASLCVLCVCVYIHMCGGGCTWACGGQRLALLVFLYCFSLTGLFAFRQGLSGLELAGLARLTGRQDPGVLWSLPLQHQDDRHTQPYRLFYARTKVLMFAWQASF